MNNTKTLKVLSPFDQILLKEVPMVGSKEVETALEKAYSLFFRQKSMDSFIQKN